MIYFPRAIGYRTNNGTYLLFVQYTCCWASLKYREAKSLFQPLESGVTINKW